MFELLINLQLKQMCVVPTNSATDVVEVCYPVAQGKSSSPTPLGKFTIERVVVNPSFTSCKNGVNYGSGFLGSLALVTNKQTSPGCSFAIHGTNNEALVTQGAKVSEGCIRMKNSDIQHLEANYLPFITGGSVN